MGFFLLSHWSWPKSVPSIHGQTSLLWHHLAFLSNQCIEIEENNRMGKTRALFKKIRDTKGIFHAKMGSIKGLQLEKIHVVPPSSQDEALSHYSVPGEVPR